MKKLMPLCLTLLLCGCMVGPDYKKPTVLMTNGFKEAHGKMIAGNITHNKDWKTADPQDAINRGEWWKVFNDSTLNELEAHLNITNQSIANAYQNFCQAKALIAQARANFFPTVNGSYTLTRQKQGTGAVTFVNSSQGGTSTGTATTGRSTEESRIVTNQSLVLNSQWEPDIWGLVRRTVEGNIAGAQASAALLALTQLSAQASLAQYYFELRGLDIDQRLYDDTVRNYRQALRLTQNQYRSGTVSEADVLLAQSQLQTAEAQAINNGILRGQYEHAIAVLMGVPPAGFGLKPRASIQKVPAIPLTVPSVLLERRPDIAQAERLMAQANAQIGVAVAAYYPTLNLTATLSNSARSFSRLFSLPTLGWSYGPQISALLFDGGLRQANVAIAEAGYRATIATYRQTVLTAFQEVEDNLIALRLLQLQAVVQNQAAQTARQALIVMTNQYRAGIVPYTSVITAQNTAFTAEKNAADITYLRLTAAVGLIKALGGGWHASCINCV